MKFKISTKVMHLINLISLICLIKLMELRNLRGLRTGIFSKASLSMTTLTVVMYFTDAHFIDPIDRFLSRSPKLPQLISPPWKKNLKVQKRQIYFSRFAGSGRISAVSSVLRAEALDRLI